MNNPNRSYQEQLSKLLNEAKRIASKFRALTEKPLGITGEVAEDEAARLLNLTPRQAGYDATELRAGV